MIPSGSATTDIFDEGTVDPEYQAKACVLNAAIQEVGMGRYQWWLFAVAGFGWFADSVWPLLAGLILSPVVSEFHVDAPFLTLAFNIGLFVGAIFWGFSCDIWSRRWCFNQTLLLSGIFGLAAGGSPNFVTLAACFAVLGIGVGGNLPVDSAVFLDFVPASHQYLLTVLSIWWSVGQLVASFIAWPLIANFSCPQGARTCARADNMGWRYLLFTVGGMTLLLWAVRCFAFPLFESPRFLVVRGRDAEAVAVIHRLAHFNGRTTSLTADDLEAAARAVCGSPQGAGERKAGARRSSVFTADHIKALFATPKLAWSTSLLIFLWGILGLASTLYSSFLPYLLASRGAQFGDGSYYITYRTSQMILGVIGVPGAFLAGWAVEQPYIGRRGTLALSAGLTGAFLLASTTARSSNALLGWNCGYTFHNNAPVIALYANLETAVPVYVSGALVIGAGFVALLLPYEPRGKASI
ncbi:major facilitator superfamily domain-containing protein [Trametes maxima]|nr:major facilitator superfamily domain-containing protein [Trametes maxima]